MRLFDNKRCRILAIGAHPDDIFLGAGAYLLQLRQQGHQVRLLTLTSGALGGDRVARENEERAAARLCGFEVTFGYLPDGHIALPQAIDCIASMVDEICPDMVLTHSPADTHQDHIITSQATVSACRDVGNLFYYEGPSSTLFAPTMTVDCTAGWDTKIAALDCHRSQMQRRPYIEWAKAVGAYRAWPRHVGRPCEAFTAVRHDPCRFPTIFDDRFTDQTLTERTYIDVSAERPYIHA